MFHCVLNDYILTCALHPHICQVFTYEDSNMVLAKRIVERGHGFTTHSRVVISQLKADKAQSKNTRKKKGSKSTKKSISRLAGSDSSTESTFNTSDFLRALHRNANQTSPSRFTVSTAHLLTYASPESHIAPFSNSSHLRSIWLSLGQLSYSFRFVRYGGKASAAPCPHLARDAAPDYGEDPSLWLGSAGVISSAHFDLFDNFFCLVCASLSPGNFLLFTTHILRLILASLVGSTEYEFGV